MPLFIFRYHFTHVLMLAFRKKFKIWLTKTEGTSKKFRLLQENITVLQRNETTTVRVIARL